jgi:hypothetical protein
MHTVAAAGLTLVVLYLLFAYALGGPIVFGQLLVGAVVRRRRRYRAVPDDILATSRFTIPVSVIVPAAGEDVTEAVAHLLQLNYPEFEIIVVTDAGPALDALRHRFALSAWEVFYRRTLPTSPVRGIYRSTSDPRLLVAHCGATIRGDALNCGVNLARYRYVCCADPDARYARDALLNAMRAAVEDPAQVVAVTTSLAPLDPEAVNPPIRGAVPALQCLSRVRALLARNARRRLGLGDLMTGFTLWRRDVVVETGGFAVDGAAEQLEMTLRVHRHLLRERVPYGMVHLPDPVGSPIREWSTPMQTADRQQRHQAMIRILWRYRGMLLNPRYGRIGMLDLPAYMFAAAVVPWLELACLIALPIAALAGALSWFQFGLLVAAIALGNAVLLDSAMLLAPWPPDDASQVRLVALAPLEVFVSRPVQLYTRLTGLLQAALNAAGARG